LDLDFNEMQTSAQRQHFK